MRLLGLVVALVSLGGTLGEGSAAVAVRRVEGEPALLGASPHLLAVGQKV
jgi:hypothetical protein